MYKYKPRKVGNKWVTPICSTEWNEGIHDQSQLRSAVGMIEVALNNWHQPRLIHLILTKATDIAYGSLIDSMRKAMPLRAYKAATEVDAFKGTHVHWMLIVDSSTPEATFDLSDDYSALSKALTLIRQVEPSFEIEIAQPYKHPYTPYIPINVDTLDDVVDWFSYCLKLRSKPPAGSGISCYRSSRKQRHTPHIALAADDWF